MLSLSPHIQLQASPRRTLLGWAIALLAFLAAPALATPESGGEASALANKSKVTPGDQLVIAVILDHAEGWHSHTNAPKIPASWVREKFDAIPTVIETQPAPGLKYGPIQWPKAHTVSIDLIGKGRPESYDVFEGRAIAYIPVVLDPNAAPGPRTLNVKVVFQSCDDKICNFTKTETFPISLEVLAPGSAADAPSKSPDFAEFDPSVFSKINDGSVQPLPLPPASSGASQSSNTNDDAAQFNVFGLSFSLNTGTTIGFVLLLLIAFFGGLIMNLMPCVLPVIPLKIMALTKSSESKARTRFLGAMMSLGVIVFWVAIGAVIALSTSFKAASQLISIWWVSTAIGAFMIFMALGMFGIFDVALPQWVYSVNPKQGTSAGSFAFGALTGVLAMPCIAPLLGTAIAWAAFQPVHITMLTFGCAGFGMALPYYILAVKPEWLSRIPRAGPASDLLKQVLGLLILAVAVFFIGTGFISLAAEMPYVAKTLHWWVIAALFLVTGVWLIMRIWLIGKSSGSRLTMSLLALALAFAGISWAHYLTKSAASSYVPSTEAAHSTGLWKPYSKELFDRSIAEGKVVVLDFTADWCLNCKTLRATVLDREDTRRALEQGNVVALEADLTARNAPGWEKIRELKEAGIPLLVIWGPGLERPWKSNGYTIADVVSNVQRAGQPRQALRPSAP